MNPFNSEKIKTMRAEIRRDGLLADKFLSNDPDLPVSGLNLACAWPFPPDWRDNYEVLAQRLQALGPEIYVYPFEFTHITLVTFASFARQERPEAKPARPLKTRIPQILEAIEPLFATNSPKRIRQFTLEPQPLVLARAAAILPLANADGEVSRLRNGVLEMLQRRSTLHDDFAVLGLNIPGIIHSTLLRFRQPPADLEAFLAAFDTIAAETSFPPMSVREVLLTSELKPYMRAGQILRRLELSLTT